MAAGSGQISSYNNTVPQKRVVTDRIITKEPMSIVAITALGLHNEDKFAFVNTPGTAYDWLEDTFAPVSDTAVSGLTSASTLTQVTVTTSGLFQVGDVILIDAEYMWVSEVSTTLLSVTRGYGGTQATHADTSVVYLRGRNRLEGAAAGNGYFTVVSSTTNYSAILQKTIEIARSNALLKNYGIENVVEREIDKVMDEQLMQLNYMAYHGQRKAGSATTPRGFGGIPTFATTNKNALSSTPALLRKHIEDEFQDIFDNGGVTDLILTSAWGKRKINDFFQGFIRTERDEKFGGHIIDFLMNPVTGDVARVLVDRHCQSDRVSLLDTRYLGYITIDPFFEEELAKTKDTAYYGQVVGEYGFVLAYEKAHSYISGFSTSV